MKDTNSVTMNVKELLLKIQQQLFVFIVKI